MTPAERFVRALRDAADAFEEVNGGKAKQRRRRGLIPVSTGREIPADIRDKVAAKFAAEGYRAK
jgi:hypothetical protein